MGKFNGTAIKNRQANNAGVKKLKLTKDNSFLVFPFDLIAGYITSTENGLRNNDNVNVDNYSQFARVFTGLESMIAQWDQAYSVIKKNPTDTFLTKEYKVGRNLRAFIPSENLGASFEPSTISSDFLAEYTDEEITMTVYDDIEEQDLFRLFIIPELREEKWLFISDAIRYFHNGELHHVEITLTTLNNKVAKSGGAIESFIQRGAPGEGYAWPIVDENQVVSLDEIRSRDVPITSGQIEMAGPAGFNTIVAYGRPTIQKTEDGITSSTFNPKIEAPRLLLPLRLETAVPSPENTRPSAETDYYVGNFKPTLQTEYKSWKDQFQAGYDLSQRNQYEGVLISDENLAGLRASNPVDSKGTHTHELWDTSWVVAVDETKDTTPNNMTGDKIVLKGDYTPAQLLAHQFFITSHLSSLPLTVQQNVAWSLADIPILGGFLSKITLGVPIGWQNLSVRLAMENVKIIMPSSLAEYGNVLKGDGTPSDGVWIPLETFSGTRKDEATEYSGINATGTIFKYQLTHRFKKTINGVEYTFDTIDLGQAHPTTDDNGTTIAFADPSAIPKALLWDETCSPTDRGDTPGYVIDLSHFKALAKLVYRQTFFSNDIQAYSGTYQTKAQFTESTRDWTNSMKLSHWVENNNEIVEYPKVITAPNPPGSNYSKVQIENSSKVDMTISPNKWYIANKETGSYTGLLKDARSYIASGVNGRDINVQPGIKELQRSKTVYDLDNIGGATSLKNNYKKIVINYENKSFEIETNELITSGSKEIIFDSKQGIKIDYTEPNQKTGTYNMDWTAKLHIIISGNELQIINESVYDMKIQNSLRIEGGGRFFNGVNFTYSNIGSIQTLSDWKNFTIIPKSII